MLPGLYTHVSAVPFITLNVPTTPNTHGVTIYYYHCYGNMTHRDGYSHKINQLGVQQSSGCPSISGGLQRYRFRLEA